MVSANKWTPPRHVQVSKYIRSVLDNVSKNKLGTNMCSDIGWLGVPGHGVGVREVRRSKPWGTTNFSPPRPSVKTPYVCPSQVVRVLPVCQFSTVWSTRAQGNPVLRTPMQHVSQTTAVGAIMCSMTPTKWN